ncbi:hypothetical protein V8B97DRAFT_1917629 [Scleroderma yunnanense]
MSQHQLDGMTHASCIPLSVASTSTSVESPSSTDMPYTVWREVSRLSPPPTDPHSQFSTGIASPPERTHPDPQNLYHRHHRRHHDTSETSLGVPADPIDGPHNLGLSRGSTSPCSSLSHLPGLPPTPNVLLQSRSPSAMSCQSGGSNRSVRSSRRHEGATARVRLPHHHAVHSVTSIVTSMASPSGVVAQLDGTNVVPPGNCDFPGGPTPVPEGVPPRFIEMTSNDVNRYQKDCFRVLPASNYKVPAMQLEYGYYGKELPTGWTACRHPEGALYYMNSEKRTFTEVDVREQKSYSNVEYFSEFLWEELRFELRERDLESSLNLDEVQLVLKLHPDDDGVCYYYFVNPAGRSLFWLEEWDAPGIFDSCRSVDTLPHKGLAIQALYWYILMTSVVCRRHWALFPTLFKVTPRLKEEAKAMIRHTLCDHLTSNLTSSPGNPEELKTFLSLLEGVDSEWDDNEGYGASTFGRIMMKFCMSPLSSLQLSLPDPCIDSNYYLNFHVTTLQHLHTIFVDRTISKEKWNVFDTNLLATVLLTSNVGFLAINSVDSGRGVSLRQIASYLSLMASFGSIMLETLAIIYSLPHAFLVWGMILFFVALSAEWWNLGGLVSWIAIGIATLAICVLVGWCIWMARDRTQHWFFTVDLYQASLVNDQPEDQGEYIGRRPSHPWLIMRIPHYVSSIFGSQNGRHSEGNNNEYVEEIAMRSVLVAVPAGGNLDMPDGEGHINKMDTPIA